MLKKYNKGDIVIVRKGTHRYFGEVLFQINETVDVLILIKNKKVINEAEIICFIEELIPFRQRI